MYYFHSFHILDAFDALVERLNSASFAKDVKAKEDDINFLSDFMNDPLIQALVEVSVNPIHTML